MKFKLRDITWPYSCTSVDIYNEVYLCACLPIYLRRKDVILNYYLLVDRCLPLNLERNSCCKLIMLFSFAITYDKYILTRTYIISDQLFLSLPGKPTRLSCLFKIQMFTFQVTIRYLHFFQSLASSTLEDFLL